MINTICYRFYGAGILGGLNSNRFGNCTIFSTNRRQIGKIHTSGINTQVPQVVDVHEQAGRRRLPWLIEGLAGACKLVDLRVAEGCMDSLLDHRW